MDTPTTTAPTDPPAAATALAPKTDSKVLVPMDRPLENIDQVFRLANAIAPTEFVPKAYRNKPHDILAAILQGHELGLAPMQALASLCVVGGIASLWGDGLLAVVIAAPVYLKHDEHYLVDGKRRDTLTPDDYKKDTTAAVCTFWRRGQDEPTTNTYTIAHAKKAGLWTKAGTWQTNPDRMLKMRARGFAARDCFPDVVRGIRTVEEMRDVTPSDEMPVVREVTRLSERPAPDVEPSVTSEPPAAAPDVVDLDPASVKDVAAFLGGYTVTLSNGMQVDVTDDTDALDLEKFKGTPTKLRLTVKRVVDTMQLVSFAVAD